ncbi:O-methyltransferase, family 2, partial [Metarhizium majus ARSEF 297]
MAIADIEKALTELNAALRTALKTLGSDCRQELMQSLHSPDELPEKHLYDLSTEAVDLLQETKLLLEPRTVILADHFLGSANCKCLNAAVELDVPDILQQQGALTITQLAQKCGAREDRMKQVMRVLQSAGIFSYEQDTAVYSNNECSTLLLKDHWTGWRNWVDLYGNEFYDMARGIPASCRQGEKRMPSQINFDTALDMFSWFAAQGSLDRVHRTLGGGAIAQAPGILADYPWEQVAGGLIVDIGGGGGGLIAMLLRKFPNLRGGIFDRAEVINQAVANFCDPDGLYRDVGDRVSKENLHAGDFFKEIPSYEVYCMKWCLHDWRDNDVVTILKNIRKAIIPGPKSRLVLLEILLRKGRSGHLSRMADLSVMMAANGLEREEWEWDSLAAQSGWKIARKYDLRNAWPCAMELVPV